MAEFKFNKAICRQCHEAAGYEWNGIVEFLWHYGDSCIAVNAREAKLGDSHQRLTSPPPDCLYMAELIISQQKTGG